MIMIEPCGDVQRIEMSVTLLGTPIFPMNSYVVGDLLIDTGAANLTREFLKAINPSPIKTVVNTHAHPDHTGSNYAFSFVYVHPEGFERLKTPRTEMMLQKFLYGLPKPSNPQKVPESIKAGDYTFKVLYTPGHSPDHITLYEPSQKWAFTGDLLLAGPTREVFIDVEIYDAMHSLRTLSKLDIETLFPGHGVPFRNPKEALTQQIKTLENFETKIKELHEEGLTPGEIRNRIFGRERIFTYLTGRKFSALNLVKSYLEPLREQ